VPSSSRACDSRPPPFLGVTKAAYRVRRSAEYCRARVAPVAALRGRGSSRTSKNPSSTHVSSDGRKSEITAQYRQHLYIPMLPSLSIYQTPPAPHVSMHLSPRHRATGNPFLHPQPAHSTHLPRRPHSSPLLHNSSPPITPLLLRHIPRLPRHHVPRYYRAAALPRRRRPASHTHCAGGRPSTRVVGGDFVYWLVRGRGRETSGFPGCVVVVFGRLWWWRRRARPAAEVVRHHWEGSGEHGPVDGLVLRHGGVGSLSLLRVVGGTRVLGAGFVRWSGYRAVAWVP